MESDRIQNKFLFDINEMKSLNILSSGNFTDVFKLKDQKTNKFYAVKCSK